VVYLEFNFEETEIIRIMYKLPTFHKQIEDKSLKSEIMNICKNILHEYYLENTQGIKGKWTKEFQNSGVSEDDGKNAISCGRRLGMDIY